MTQQVLMKTLKYDATTGKFTRLTKTKKKIGTITENGYLRININKKLYLAHRLAWLYMTGDMPADEIDHIDHDRENNSWDNLREVTSSENSKNSTIPITNTSGQVGISWNKKAKKWSAQIKIDGTKKHLGLFIDYHEAVNARKDAEILYGFHANHGGA